MSRTGSYYSEDSDGMPIYRRLLLKESQVGKVTK